MKPIVSFDVDMTLLDHKNWEIPESAMAAIEKLRGRHRIVIATGRDMDNSYSAFLKEKLRPDAIIHLNGTKVTVGDELIFEHKFDKELLRRLLEDAQREHYSLGATIMEADYFTHKEGVVLHDMELWGKCSRHFEDPWRLPDLEVRTLAYIGGEPKAKEVEKRFPEVSVHMFEGKKGADVVEKEASKAVGLKRLCEYFGESLSRTVAFGDSMNDYDIVRTAGLGIAMGNAMQELKDVADYVTDCIDEDGIWNACRRFGMI